MKHVNILIKVKLVYFKENSFVHIQARGGFYSEGPAKEVEFGDCYLRTVLNFVGITDIQTVVTEGMNFDPSKAESIVAKAIEHAREVAKDFAKEK